MIDRVEMVRINSSRVIIAGGSSDCSCIAISELPKELKGGDSVIVPVRIRLPDKEGGFSREFRFAVTEGSYFTISGKIVGNVRTNECG